MKTDLIRFDSVSKSYDTRSRKALDDISFEADRGEFVFLVGASGSGKSTVIRLILREEVPSAGRIHIAGKSVVKMPSWKVPYLRRGIGTVFQDFRLLPNKTVFENVAFALEVTGTSRRKIGPAVERVLALVGLTSRRSSTRTSCPAGSSSGRRSPARWSTTRGSSSPTSPRATSTR